MARGLRISEAASMAAHALALLAERRGERMTTEQIASQLQVSAHHLAKVLLRLSKVGFVKSARGRHGGFTLTRTGESATLLEVIESIDGRLTSEERLIVVPADAQAAAGAGQVLLSVKDRLVQGLAAISVGEVWSVLSEDRPGPAGGEVLGGPAADWRVILDSINDAVAVHDINTREIVHVNRKFCEMSGFTVEEARRLGIAATSTDESPYAQKDAAEWMRKAVEEGPQAFEWQVHDVRGQQLVVELSLQRMDLGNREFVVGIGKDITRRRGAEEAARRSKELFEKTFLSQRDALFILDAQSPAVILDCNPAATEMFGYSRAEMVGRTAAFLHVDGASLEDFRRHLHAGIEEQGFMHLPEFRVKRKDGTIFPAEHTAVPLLDEDGERIGWVSLVRDITERKAAEEALQESEARFRGFFDNASHGMALIDRSGSFTLFNARAAQMLGYRPEEMAQTTPLGLTHPDDLEFSLRHLREILDGEADSYRIEKRYLHKDGSSVWVDLSVRPIHNSQGQIEAVLGILVDINERKRTQEALHDSARRWQATFDAISDAVCLLDADGAILQGNKAMEELVGMPSSQMVGLNCCELVHGTSEPLDGCPIVRARESLRRESLVLPLPEGRHLHVTAAPLLDGAGRFTGSVHTLCDITERKAAEEELRRSAAILEAMPHGVTTTDMQGTILDINTAVVEQLGYKKEELIGKTALDLLASDEDRVRFHEQRDALVSGEATAPVRCRAGRKDGRVRTFDISFSILQDDQGKAIGVVAVTWEVPQSKQAHQQPAA